MRRSALSFLVAGLLSIAFAAIPFAAHAQDADGDGVPDATDNCTLALNPLQTDTDLDGTGNRCDPDFNNDCIVNSLDASLFQAVLASGSNNPLFDLNGSGVVSPTDFTILVSYLGSPAGPPGCSVPVGTVSGFVRDFNQNPLAGVRVDVGGVFANSTSSGSYQIQYVPYGSYAVHASGNGYTFGSPAYQAANYAVVVSAGTPAPTKNVLGYNRNPIVYVHGWNSGTGSLAPYPSLLFPAGYKDFYADLETSLTYTPSLHANAAHVEDAIDEAKYTTGKDKVILIGHSMGGLVARSYLESAGYQDDVAELFTLGSPHGGIPEISSFACALNQPGVCDMTKAGMALFNATHAKRKGVDYHEIGGDAPIWGKKEICIKIFRRKFCVRIPWPDLNYRNGLGWALGFLIAGDDDAFIQTCSTVGQPAGLDRYLTREVHDTGLGPRSYLRWDGGPSQEAYNQCLAPRLVSASIHSCGTRDAICGVGGGNLQEALQTFGLAGAAVASTSSDPFSAPATFDDAAQRAQPQTGTINPGQTISRSVVVEGGGVSFSFQVQAGSAAVHLVDPTGKTIDPDYVAETMVGTATDPDAEYTTEVDPGIVDYKSDVGSAHYYLPNALSGTWQMVAVGNSDIPAGGTGFASEIAFESPFAVAFSADTLFPAPGTSTSFSLALPPISGGAAVAMSVTLPSGGTASLSPTPVGGGVYTAVWSVPDDPGYARVDWSVTGVRADGVAFERGGFEHVQIRSSELVWSGVQQVTPVPRPGDPTLYESLDFEVGIASGYSGEAQVSADLVDPVGTPVAHVNQIASLTPGANTVVLSMDGDEIYASGLNGSYTLTHVVLADARSAAILVGQIDDDYTTGSYQARQFAAQHGAPTVATTGPYTARAGQSLTLAAAGSDPEGDSLTYAWDLDGNGSFETSGQSVPYSAPLVTQTTSVRAVVRATDTGSHTATAETFIDVSPIVPGSPTNGVKHEITIEKPAYGGPPGSTGVQVVTLGPLDAHAIACGYQVILEPGTSGGLAGGPSNWSDVAVFYDSAAGCAAACPSGTANRILLISDSSADPDSVLSEEALGSACLGLSSAAVQAGRPGTPTFATPEGTVDGYEHTNIDAPARDARTTITVTNAGAFLPEPDFELGLVAGILGLAACARAREKRQPGRGVLVVPPAELEPATRAPCDASYNVEL